MQAEDTAALEAEAWGQFVTQLAGRLAGLWPAMPERLAARYPAFVELTVQQALDQGLQRAASVARFANLCFVWGPAFHDKPGFEWAAPLLASARQQEWLAVHQLVQRSLQALQALPGARIDPQALAAADAAMLDAFGPLGQHGRMHRAEALPAPAAACDLETADIRLIDKGGHQLYRLGADAQWQRQAVAMPGALRLAAGQPGPQQVAALSHPVGQGPVAHLQLRLQPLATCHADVHPALGFCGPHGRWAWAGHAAKAASWPLATREHTPAAAGPGTAIAEETSPELHRLDIETCGLRDQGDALGKRQLTVSVWPATQWWTELQRARPEPQAWLPGPPAGPRPATRCRVERDGQAQDAAPLRRQFESGLDAACAAGLQALAAHWQRLPGLAAARLEAQLGLLVGQASLSWGWHWGPGGLGSPALMRLQGQLALDACLADLVLGGDLGDDPGAAPAGAAPGSAPLIDTAWLGDTRTRITLRFAGQAPLQQALLRETPAIPLSAVLGGAVARWRYPAELTLQALATETGCLLQQASAASGALVGEAGLRPRTSGGSGWEWYAQLRIEPVDVPVMLTDPVAGNLQRKLSLLPALTLLDWSLG